MATAIFASSMVSAISIAMRKRTKEGVLAQSRLLHEQATDASGDRMRSLGVAVAKRARSIAWIAVAGGPLNGVSRASVGKTELWMSYVYGEHIRISVPKRDGARLSATFRFDRTQGGTPTTDHKIATALCDAMPQREEEISRIVDSILEEIAQSEQATQ